VGLSESDIIDVVRMVEDWLRSRETRRFLHSFLFDFYRDYKPLLELGSRKNNVVEHMKRPQLKAIEAIDREAEPTTYDVHIKAKFEEVNQMIDEECESLKAVMVKEADAKRLIPDLIDVRTIQQKAVIALAYYYHYRDPDNFSADSEARKNLVREWPKSKVSDTSPDAEEIPVPTAIGFQFFVEECSQVPNISQRGHKLVEKWVTEVTEACEQAEALPKQSAGRKADNEKMPLALKTHEEYSYDKEQARAVGAPFYKPHWAKENSITLVELNRRLALARYHLKKE